MSSVPYIRVAEVMQREIRKIDAMSPVSQAMRAMRDASVRSLVIERRDERDEYGLILIADIAREVIAQNRSPDRVSVYEIMSKPALTLDADMDIKYAVRLLAKIGVSRGLVVDHDRNLVGLVTMRDMVLAYAE